MDVEETFAITNANNMQLNILGRVIVGLNTHFYVDVDLRRLQSYPVQINTLNALFLSLSLFSFHFV